MLDGKLRDPPRAVGLMDVIEIVPSTIIQVSTNKWETVISDSNKQ
jgi:hypothetical protein